MNCRVPTHLCDCMHPCTDSDLIVDKTKKLHLPLERYGLHAIEGSLDPKWHLTQFSHYAGLSHITITTQKKTNRHYNKFSLATETTALTTSHGSNFSIFILLVSFTNKQ